MAAAVLMPLLLPPPPTRCRSPFRKACGRTGAALGPDRACTLPVLASSGRAVDGANASIQSRTCRPSGALSRIPGAATKLHCGAWGEWALFQWSIASLSVSNAPRRQAAAIVPSPIHPHSAEARQEGEAAPGALWQPDTMAAVPSELQPLFNAFQQTLAPNPVRAETRAGR